MSITLYTNPMSRGKIAEWMLAEVGVPYEKVELEYGVAMKSPEFLALNPMGKVPTLVHDGHVVTEAAAICLYLAQAFPEANLLPIADEAADYYRWTVFAAATLEQGLVIRGVGLELDERQKAQMGCGDVEGAVQALAAHLSRNAYVAGERFTAADVYVGSQLNFFVRMFKMVPSCAAFDDYLNRVTSRAAFSK
ncbi:MAG: glutathione S-transferase family protein [Formosimonas sp.]